MYLKVLSLVGLAKKFIQNDLSVKIIIGFVTNYQFEAFFLLKYFQ